MDNKKIINIYYQIYQIKGVGLKTVNLLKKKRLITFLIYYGNYLNHYRLEAYHQKSKIYE